MAITSDFITLQRHIADDLGNRTDLLSGPLSDSGLVQSPIKFAILSAISKWEREIFYFNEVYNDSTPMFTTIAGQEIYATTEIMNSPDIYSLHALINANRLPLIKRTWQEIEKWSGNPAARGQPTDWAYLGQSMRLYPIPDGAYPIRASRLEVQLPLIDPADSSCWTRDGYDLIRSEAKLILALEVLQDDEIAKRMKIAIYGDPAIKGDRGYLYALKAETTRRAATGRVKVKGHF